jgi:hypothetical protein
MANYHHRPIRKFNLSGVIHDDSAIARLREEYTRLIVTEMRSCGCVPRFDIDLDFTIDYNETKEYFEFEITIYGTYVGRRQSEWIAGLDKTKPIYIAPTKSKEYSQEQV